MVTAAITWVGVKDKRPTAPLPLLNLPNSAGLATLYLQFLLMLYLLLRPMLLFPALATDPSTLLKNKVDIFCCLIYVESPPISQSFLISNDAGRFVDRKTQCNNLTSSTILRIMFPLKKSPLFKNLFLLSN